MRDLYLFPIFKIDEDEGEPDEDEEFDEDWEDDEED